MNFKEEYKSAMNEFSPDENTVERIEANVLRQINAQKQKQKKKRPVYIFAGTFSAAAACLLGIFIITRSAADRKDFTEAEIGYMHAAWSNSASASVRPVPSSGDEAADNVGYMPEISEAPQSSTAFIGESEDLGPVGIRLPEKEPSEGSSPAYEPDKSAGTDHIESFGSTETNDENLPPVKDNTATISAVPANAEIKLIFEEEKLLLVMGGEEHSFVSARVDGDFYGDDKEYRIAYDDCGRMFFVRIHGDFERVDVLSEDLLTGTTYIAN